MLKQYLLQKGAPVKGNPLHDISSDVSGNNSQYNSEDEGSVVSGLNNSTMSLQFKTDQVEQMAEVDESLQH